MILVLLVVALLVVSGAVPLLASMAQSHASAATPQGVTHIADVPTPTPTPYACVLQICFDPARPGGCGGGGCR
jgi:hypothetical protein